MANRAFFCAFRNLAWIRNGPPPLRMNQRELKELIEFLIEKDISEFELERGDVKVRIKRGGVDAAQTPTERIITVHPAPATAVPATPVTPPPPVSAPVASQEELHMVRSPIVGTYYESPSPGSPPFVKPGDSVEAGQVLCIVEAMKLMNEIEADVGGEIVKCLVKNGQPIEYGQDLFAIRPKK
jgi:acetyl-CoA carboxylase biotin carboxyl carrier protein